jgi:glutaminyl-peptide cyclotransferase
MIIPMKMNFINTLFLVLSFTSINSCSGTSEKKEVKSNPSGSDTRPSRKLIEILSPADNAVFSLKDRFALTIAPAAGSPRVDSIQMWYAGKMLKTAFSVPVSVPIDGLTTRTPGERAVKVIAYSKGFRPQAITLSLTVVSDIVPEIFRYKIKRVFPHDRKAFTQGLIWEDGHLYEGTGQPGESCLRKVELETGKVISQVNIDPQLFGEGIAVMGDRIYQLTWTSKVGFVYDKKSFAQINKVYYQTEGWGLTTMGNKLLMSDGSNTIWFLDPDFNVISSVEVWDNKGKVNNLNELEMVEGELWANIWQTDKIARIDPATGKVLGYIDLDNLLPRNQRKGEEDVLNGIAYDTVGKHIYVTGKWWPKLFEIEVIKKGRN